MTLSTIPTLHDLALQSGAYYDKADPAVGFPNDSYVFSLPELKRLADKLLGVTSTGPRQEKLPCQTSSMEAT